MTSQMNLDELKDFAQGVFDSQPFSTFLDARLVDATPTSAKIAVRNRIDLQQQHGYVHGGVISYLADNSLTFAGGLALGGDALTAEYKINYAKPATGEEIVAEAETISTSRTQAVCRCNVYSCSEGERTLVAVALGTIVAARRRKNSED
ncbi:PaaI family thioesterase [Corynebacterium sp.]|uniref:PaaI family thioesterase n=1 Tax=Corynebacterium sp. TaxID=1720 RepID=UPI0028A683AA|nr:PaaI family thioesterase [Corynebacterium sp.]